MLTNYNFNLISISLTIFFFHLHIFLKYLSDFNIVRLFMLLSGMFD